MNMHIPSKSYQPLLFASVTIIFFLTITQLIAYQRQQIIRKSEHNALQHELNNTVSRFNEILDHKISSANTIAIIYNQYKKIENFDSIAKQILAYDSSIDFVSLTDKYTMKHVYPLEGNSVILGHSLLEVPLFRKELELAVKNRQVLFAGPYKLTNNRGFGIACRIPIFDNDSFRALVSVITKLPTIIGHIPQFKNSVGKFVFRIVKINPATGKKEYYLDGFDPGENNIISSYMPIGGWTVQAAYSSTYSSPHDAVVNSIIGILLSLALGLYVYNRTKLPLQLENLVVVRTHQLGERIKELSTIYTMNEILKDDEQSEAEVFNKIVRILPPGWQFPGECAARIYFDGKNYATDNYSESSYKQQAKFELIDGRTGVVEVLYISEKPAEYEGSFLKEERDLINTIADTIAVYFNKAIQKKILAESERKFRGAFDDAAIGMAIASLDGKWQRVNKSLCEIVGYTEAELESMSFKEITHPDDISNDIEFIKRVVTGEQDVFRTEKRYFHKNGHLVWVNLNVATIRDNENKPLFFIAQIENITDRIESQMMFQNLVEESLVGVYIILEGKLVYVNPKLIEESGYSNEELLGTGLEQYIHPDDLPMVLNNMEARLNGKIDGNRYEARIINKNKEILWLDMFPTITMINGKTAIIGTLVNNTERKQLEEERQKIINDLVQRNRDLEQFAHILSHNVRAPLSTILGLCNLIKDEQNAGDRPVAVEGIEHSAVQLDVVIKDLNEILHIKRDISELKTNIKLSEVVSEVKHMLANPINTNSVILDTDFTDADEIITVHSYIHSIIYNLVSNAIKYRRQNVVPYIKISTQKIKSGVLIKVQDNGIGIDMKRYGDQLFGLYKRFNYDIEGKGMGLFMVKTQVEALKGTIEVSSKTGEGTEFVITFDK